MCLPYAKDRLVNIIYFSLHVLEQYEFVERFFLCVNNVIYSWRVIFQFPIVFWNLVQKAVFCLLYP